jgi:2,3-bisphosphoglycerate-dependent phosphoglycerate mutase
MTDCILLIRHCQTTGQEPGAPLSEQGKTQALFLAECLREHAPGRLISSPFTRALDSIAPLARRLELEVQPDPRLAEWQIMPDAGPDSKVLAEILDGRRAAPAEQELRDAVLARVRAALSDAWEGPDGCTALVGHGKLFSVLLSDLTGRLATEIWPQLTNPDVFVLQRRGGAVCIERAWDDDK